MRGCRGIVGRVAHQCIPYACPGGIPWLSGTDFRPLVQKWNLAVQRELPGRWRSKWLMWAMHQIHQIGRQTRIAAPTWEPTTQISPAQFAAPIAYISGQATVVDTFGDGNYNALTVKLEKRLSNGLKFISAYTWSHAISDFVHCR